MHPTPAAPAPPGSTLPLTRRITEALRRRVVGQDRVLDRLVVALLAGGHVLLEGVPGVAKTRMVRSLADAVSGTFRRIQFTPDLLPSDVVGTLVWREDLKDFVPAPGPVFANLVLADEINRAPPKVQSALLEAMEERQVTLGGVARPLEEPFLVLATRNPLEQHGTYPLAEAQLDRFMMMVKVGYPGRSDEYRILRMAADREGLPEGPVATVAEVLAARGAVDQVRVDDRILEYVVELVRTTRAPQEAGLPALRDVVEVGASPRAGLFLAAAARAQAWQEGRDHVLPDDVKAVAPDVLRHRLLLGFEAEARGVTADRVVQAVLAAVPVP